MIEWAKPFLKKSERKSKKKQKINIEMPHVIKKQLTRNENLIQTKN